MAPISSVAQQYYYPSYAEYTTAITSGAISLGIEVPAHLQREFADRHGQYLFWSVAEETGSDHTIQAMGFDLSSGCHAVPYQQVVRYGNEYGKWEAHLVGVGAQFDRC